MAQWTTDQIGSMEGKTIVVTGGGSGIGFEAASVLASKGAEVILAVRNEEKGNRAAKQIHANDPHAKVSVMHLDLGDLSSVKQFAEQFSDRFNRLDVLINNAGVMIPPYRKTKDGFELQFGTNHLGHFALTGRLLPALLAAPGSRIVTVSSIASRGGTIHFDNLDGRNGYSTFKFYQQSKLANLLFAVELQHRLLRSGAETISVCCHPGISSTNLLSRGSGKEAGRFMKLAMGLVSQPAAMGALPTLYAATDPDLRGGEFIGPDGKGNRKGYPAVTGEEKKLFNAPVAERLWAVSEQLTGVTYPL
ncbi:oxidoreductase [Paenibacillus thermotolerans]|uniref:oxidoreductase n=1 Tax=Paenibacillus thermotolerans TaxID=3027807 RepID=UPI002367A7CB|nr:MULTISPECIES: oxidoreductase [unclassified Paenibacillus]